MKLEGQYLLKFKSSYAKCKYLGQIWPAICFIIIKIAKCSDIYGVRVSYILRHFWFGLKKSWMQTDRLRQTDRQTDCLSDRQTD